jgi:AcrR family transcriptional regulator
MMERSPEPRPPQLPAGRGHHNLSREQVLRSQRERMLDAMIDTVAERGYNATSIVDVARRAGVARRTFYEHFGDKETCCLAAHDWLLERLANYAAPAYQRPGPWPQRIRRGLAALLTAIAYRPEGARLALVEILAAGPRAHRRHLAAIDAFAPYIDQGRDETSVGSRLPPTLARIVAGSTAARIHEQVATGHTSDLRRLHPELLYLVLLPCLGHRRAHQEMQTARAHQTGQ